MHHTGLHPGKGPKAISGLSKANNYLLKRARDVPVTVKGLHDMATGHTKVVHAGTKGSYKETNREAGGVLCTIREGWGAIKGEVGAATKVEGLAGRVGQVDEEGVGLTKASRCQDERHAEP